MGKLESGRFSGNVLPDKIINGIDSQETGRVQRRTAQSLTARPRGWLRTVRLPQTLSKPSGSRSTDPLPSPPIPFHEAEAAPVPGGTRATWGTGVPRLSAGRGVVGPPRRARPRSPARPNPSFFSFAMERHQVGVRFVGRLPTGTSPRPRPGLSPHGKARESIRARSKAPAGDQTRAKRAGRGPRRWPASAFVPLRERLRFRAPRPRPSRGA